jgi:hypothetical protein
MFKSSPEPPVRGLLFDESCPPSGPIGDLPLLVVHLDGSISQAHPLAAAGRPRRVGHDVPPVDPVLQLARAQSLIGRAPRPRAAQGGRGRGLLGLVG